MVCSTWRDPSWRSSRPARLILFVWLLSLAAPRHSTMAAAGTNAAPKTFVWDGAALVAARDRVLVHNDPALMPAVHAIVSTANGLIGKGENWTVMAKAMTPPSGSKHDYESIGPYWWPCNNGTFGQATDDIAEKCNKTSGLPWVRHDGVHNPITDHFDSEPNGHMQEAVKAFSIAYYFTGNETFAEEAVKTLKRWFLDDATRMNPNLNYGQMIPGICDGRGIGIIDTASWCALVDSIALLEGSPAMDSDTQQALGHWFGNYTNWLHTSKNGKDESNAKNNHGTWYDTQIQSFALMSGLTSLAKEVAAMTPEKRVDVEIKPDGQMPMEEARTKSKSYCTFNLRAFFNLARVSGFSGVDLWNYSSSSGASVRKAFEWMMPYALQQTAWPFKQIEPYTWSEMFELFRRASIEFREPEFETMITELRPAVRADSIINLLFPRVYF